MGKNNAVFLVLLIVLAACASKDFDPYNRGVEHYSMGRVEDSAEAYRQAIVTSPSNLEARFNLAVIYEDQGKLDDAEALYKVIVEQDNEFTPAWSNLASIQEKRGHMAEAETFHRRAMLVDRKGCAASSQFGYFLIRTQRQDEAAAVFEQSVKDDPRCANAWFGLGTIAESKGDQRTALRSYDNALIYNQSDIEACLRPVDIRISRGEKEAAEGLLWKAAILDPSRGDIKLKLGALLLDEGKLKDAEDVLEQARKAGAPPAECDRELSIVYGKLCDEAAANCGMNR